MSRNTTIALLIGAALIGGALFMVSGKPVPQAGDGVVEGQNVEIRDGVQYVTVLARGGYSPRVSYIKAGVPTKLIVETNGTYDCSAALVVRSAGFQKMLQPTGKEVIDLGTPAVGEKVIGVCGMGMYSFQIQAS